MSVDTATPAGSAGSVGDRYKLLECVAGDPEGPAVAWRAWDNLLNRPVTLTVVRPGGPAAAGFLAHAHAVSTVVHPALARVYDAVDDGDRAYVVSEWVSGTPLTALLREGPLDPEMAASAVGRMAEGIAAAHAAGVAFGGVHPDHVVVTAGGTVTLAQVVGDGRATMGDDIRGLGALLYTTLTAHWPLPATGGAGALRPATSNGRQLLTPRQVRAGVPEDLSTLAMHALEPAGPQGIGSAAAMSAVLSERVGPAEDLFDFDPPDVAPATSIVPGPVRRSPRPRWMVLAVPVTAGLATLAFLGWMLGAALGGRTGADQGSPTPSGGSVNPSGSSSGTQTRPSEASLKQVTPASTKLYCPGTGVDCSEAKSIGKATDGDLATSWTTDEYKTATYGGLTQGLGISFDLGQATKLSQIQVRTDRPHTTVQVLAGDSASGAPESYRVVGKAEDVSLNTTIKLDASAPAEYYVVWITKLTDNGAGMFWGSLSEVKLYQ